VKESTHIVAEMDAKILYIALKAVSQEMKG